MPLGVEECGIPYKEFSYVKFPTYNLLPRVDSTLVTVDIEGDKVPFSSLAMDDCVSPQSFPRFFCVSPFLFPCLDHFFHQLDYKIKLCLFLFAEDPVENIVDIITDGTSIFSDCIVHDSNLLLKSSSSRYAFSLIKQGDIRTKLREIYSGIFSRCGS